MAKGKGWHGDSAGHARAAKKRGRRKFNPATDRPKNRKQYGAYLKWQDANLNAPLVPGYKNTTDALKKTIARVRRSYKKKRR